MLIYLHLAFADSIVQSDELKATLKASAIMFKALHEDVIDVMSSVQKLRGSIDSERLLSEQKLSKFLTSTTSSLQ